MSLAAASRLQDPFLLTGEVLPPPHSSMVTLASAARPPGSKGSSLGGWLAGFAPRSRRLSKGLRGNKGTQRSRKLDMGLLLILSM